MVKEDGTLGKGGVGHPPSGVIDGEGGFFNVQQNPNAAVKGGFNSANARVPLR